MANAGQDNVQGSKGRMTMYLILAIIMLFIMALLSSLGKAFVYIFGGLAVFFFFLSFLNRAKTDDRYTDYRRSGRTATQGASFTDALRAAFRQQSAGQAGQPITDQGKRIIIMASAFIGGVFVIIVSMVVLFSGEDSLVESALAESSFYKQEGDNYYSSQDFDAAYRSYKRGIAVDENFADGYFGLGNIKSETKQYDSAIYYYNRALEISPDKLDAAYGKALVYYNKENYNQSLEELKYIFDRTDQYQNAYLLAGDSYYVTNQYQQAIGYYETAYEMGARSKELLNIMAFIYDQRGDQGKAISFYKETLQYDSTMADVYKRLGELIPGEEGNYYRAKAAGQQW
jgi:tetratricopeptide (TPR) repeat protein